MLCPQLPDEQSIALGEKRLEKAAQILGKDVLQRLLIFALYILGFNREFVARLFGYQISGVKALVDRILSNGLEGASNQSLDRGSENDSILQGLPVQSTGTHERRKCWY